MILTSWRNSKREFIDSCPSVRD